MSKGVALNEARYRNERARERGKAKCGSKRGRRAAGTKPTFTWFCEKSPPRINMWRKEFAALLISYHIALKMPCSRGLLLFVFFPERKKKERMNRVLISGILIFEGDTSSSVRGPRLGTGVARFPFNPPCDLAQKKACDFHKAGPLQSDGCSNFLAEINALNA